MKELVKPQKVEKEYNDAKAYCEGGNEGFFCESFVTCEEINFKYNECCNFCADESDDELLF